MNSDQGQVLGRLLRATEDLAKAGDMRASETLWMAFEGIARTLARLTDTKVSALDHDRMGAVLKRCLHVLKVALDRDDAEALASAYGMTEQGCKLLKQTAERNREMVARFGESAAFWPVMLGCKQMYHNEANIHLKSIRVGEKSVIPTVEATKIEATDRWTELATMLIEDIRFYRTLLLRAARGIKSRSAFEQKVENEARMTEARDFSEVLNLPAALDKKTRSQWWKVGKKLLEAYWRNNPEKAKDDFHLAGSSPPEAGKSYAIRRVRGAFNSLVR